MKKRLLIFNTVQYLFRFLNVPFSWHGKSGKTRGSAARKTTYVSSLTEKAGQPRLHKEGRGQGSTSWDQWMMVRRADWQLGAAPGADSWADLALQEGQANTGRCCMADAYYHDHHAKDLLWWPNLPLHLGTRGPFSHLSQETKTYLWVCNHTSGNLGKYPLKMSRPGI